MTLPGRRIVNIAGFLACAGMMGYALYAEYVLILIPCPLCVLQRMAVIALGVLFLTAALHDPAGWGSRIYAALIGIAAVSGIVVAGRHVWLQNMPAEEVPTCGPGFEDIIERFPLSDALAMIFTGSGECAEIDWTLLGLSMPAWVLIAVVVTGGFGIWNNLRRN